MNGVWQLYAGQMQRHGFNKTFTVDSDLHTITGDKDENHYLSSNIFGKVTTEVSNKLNIDLSRNVYLIAIELNNTTLGGAVCGSANTDWNVGRWWWTEDVGPAGGFALVPRGWELF